MMQTCGDKINKIMTEETGKALTVHMEINVEMDTSMRFRKDVL